MLFIIKGISAILLALISGCISMQQMQSGIDEIDSFWGEVNQKILSANASRVYSNEIEQCMEAAKKTATQLGFTIIEESEGFLTIRALTPTPFTKDEYRAIKDIEEPMMQAMAANHVGKFYSAFFTLDDKGIFYITATVGMKKSFSDKTHVRIEFKLHPKKEPKGYIYGTNPPPESVRKGLDKWWNTFESNLGISEPQSNLSNSFGWWG